MQIRQVLAIIDRGIDDENGQPSGVLYTDKANSAEGTKARRWVGNPLMDVLGVDEARAKIIIKDWIANGVLVRTEFYDPQRRRNAPGLKVDIDRIPGTVEGTIF